MIGLILLIYLHFVYCWRIISLYKNDDASYTELSIMYANLCQPNKLNKILR